MTSREMVFIYLLVFISCLLFFQVHHNTTLTKEIHNKLYRSPAPSLIDSITGSKSSSSHSSNCRLDDEVLKMYKIQHDRRINLMKAAKRDGDENNGFALIYNGIVPEVFCPSLVRVGSVDDGGKWMCHPNGMPAGCAIMSLGVAGDTSFEHEIQALTNQKCSIRSYDQGDPGAAIDGFDKINGFFTKAFIGSVDSPDEGKRSVRGEMERLGLKRIEILKIDIEGSEFEVIPELISQTIFCQIMIEIHGKPPKVIDFIVGLAKKGYRMFSYEINGRFHILSEYSFIHEDCLKQYEAVPLDYYWHLVD